MPQGTIFFDYDGTLHNSMLIYGPAFRKAYAWLVEQGYKEPREFSDDWISHWLGWTTVDMWTTFAPDLEENVWRQAAHIVGQEMDRLSSTGKGALFEGIPEALDTLKADGYTIAFLSNCRLKYRDAHRGYYNLDKWVSCYHCAEDFPGVPKWEIYQRVAGDGTHPYPHAMVGDRFHDIEVGTRAGIPTIGCLYGFGLEGELDTATITVDHPLQIPNAVKEILS